MFGHRVSVWLSLLLYKFIEKKARTKKLSEKLSMKATENYAERVWLTFRGYQR